MNIAALIQRIVKNGNNGLGVTLRGTPLLSLSTAQTEAPYFEMTRHGRRFHGGSNTGAAGLAPLGAIPTLTPSISLYNADTSGNGLSLSLDWLNIFLLSGVPAAGLTVWLSVFKPTPASLPSASTAGYLTGATSGSAIGSKAIWNTGPVAAANPGWSSVLSTLQPAAANIFQGDNPVDLGGRFAVPPGQALGIAITSGAGTTPLYGLSAAWSEIETDLV